MSIRIGFATKTTTNKAFHSFLMFSVFWLVCCPCPACSFIKACTVRPIFSVAILPPSIYLHPLKRQLRFCRLNDTNFIQICADVLEPSLVFCLNWHILHQEFPTQVLCNSKKHRACQEVGFSSMESARMLERPVHPTCSSDPALSGSHLETTIHQEK